MSRTQLKASTSASSSVKLAALPTSASAANVAAGSLSGTGNGLGMLKEEDTASQAAGGGGVDASALVGGDDKGGVQAAAPSQSLLKVVLDDYRADRNRTSRLLLCGELETAYGIRSEDIKMLHEDFFGQYDAKETSISGVFFGISYQYAPANSPHVYVHLLEAPSKVLYALLRLLNEDKQQAVAAAAAASAGGDDKSAAGGSSLKGGGGDHYHSELDPPMSPPPMGSAAASAAAMAAAMGRGARAGASGAGAGGSGSGGAKRLHVWQWMRSARVLSLSEEVPREFPGWFFRPALRFAAVDEYPRPTDFLQPCFAVLRNLLELGREVQPLSLDKAEEYILHKNGQPSRQFMARVPTPSQIACFMTCEDLCTIREYLDIYDSPIDFTLESEKVWPVEPFLKY